MTVCTCRDFQGRHDPICPELAVEARVRAKRAQAEAFLAVVKEMDWVLALDLGNGESRQASAAGVRWLVQRFAEKGER